MILCFGIMLPYLSATNNPGECFDGIDNDGDSQIDDLIENMTAMCSEDGSILVDYPASQVYYPKGSGGLIIIDIIEANPQILSDVPNIVKSSGVYYYNDGNKFRNLHPAYQDITADKICEGLGYDDYSELYKHVFSSCNNDAVLYYDYNSDNWYVRLGCDAGYANKQLKCSDPLPSCSDGIDNDNDCLVDMDDPGCSNPNDNNERGASNANIDCQDGIDNDGDGKSDYCFADGSNRATCDRGCFSPFDTSEEQHDLDCLTSDNEGGIECYDDSECNDYNIYTKDECVNPGTRNSYCVNNEINCVTDNDCGFTGFIGIE